MRAAHESAPWSDQSVWPLDTILSICVRSSLLRGGKLVLIVHSLQTRRGIGPDCFPVLFRFLDRHWWLLRILWCHQDWYVQTNAIYARARQLMCYLSRIQLPRTSRNRNCLPPRCLRLKCSVLVQYINSGIQGRHWPLPSASGLRHFDPCVWVDSLPSNLSQRTLLICSSHRGAR